jgi:hypothetical protein
MGDERVMKIESKVLKRHTNGVRMLGKQRKKTFPEKGGSTLL